MYYVVLLAKIPTQSPGSIMEKEDKDQTLGALTLSNLQKIGLRDKELARRKTEETPWGLEASTYHCQDVKILAKENRTKQSEFKQTKSEPTRTWNFPRLQTEKVKWFKLYLHLLIWLQTSETRLW